MRVALASLLLVVACGEAAPPPLLTIAPTATRSVRLETEVWIDHYFADVLREYNAALAAPF